MKKGSKIVPGTGARTANESGSGNGGADQTLRLMQYLDQIQAMDGNRAHRNQSSTAGVEGLPMVRMAEPPGWKKSFRVKHDDDEAGDVEETIRAGDSPPSDDYGFFESLDSGLEDDLSMRICKDAIRATLMELMRKVGGTTSRLDDLENGKLHPKNLCKVLDKRNKQEVNVCFLWSAFIGRVDLIEALLDLGADPKFVEPTDGLGALHLASYSGALDCVKFLIDKKQLDVNNTTKAFAPLHCAVFGNAAEVTKFLLAEGAWIRSPVRTEAECPLHCAVRARASDCVKLLLDYKSDPKCKEGKGWTPLHVAADRGSVNCIKLLLDNGADITARTDDKKATALHLAAEGGSAEAVEFLLARGADCEARNASGQTPLHLAARAQSLESVERLLKFGDADPNAEDNEKRTPLHAALGKAHVAYDMVEVLLSWRANVNAADKYGYTPLHVAALNELSQCVETLLYHGADVSARTKGGTTALSIISRKTPVSLAMLYQRLDADISMHDPEVSHREVELKLDFRHILQHCRKGESSFLKTFVDEEGQKSFLEHPLCQAFLHLKWGKIRKFYVARIVLWAVFTAALTLYVLMALAHDCYNEGRNATATPNFCRNNSMIGDLLRENPIIIEIEWYILVILTVCEMIRKIHGMAGYSSVRQYLCQSDNVIEWLVLLSVFVISCIFAGKTFVWQNHVAAFSVLFAWTNLMVMIGQLPLFGTYVAMYTSVQAEVAKLLLGYACLLVGFTISFCVMFPSEQTFANPFVGFIKVLVMMTGELDFEDLLFKSDKPDGKPALLLSVSAHVTFVLFLLAVTIVLMNLMVGIAVHDIQGLKKTATLSKLVRQTNLISHIELSLFNGYLPIHMQKLLRRSALVSPSGYRVVLHVKPLNPREQRLPRPVLAAAYEVAKQRKRGKHTISSHGSSVSPSRRATFIGRTWTNTQYDYENQMLLQPQLVELLQEVHELKEMIRDLQANNNNTNKKPVIKK